MEEGEMRYNGITRWLCTIGLVTAAGAASGATIVVNSTADNVADDGVCTLREAIAASVEDFPSGRMSGECAQGDVGLDRIPPADAAARRDPAGLHRRLQPEGSETQ
jgi:CSLREA domain-containing protein